MGPARRARRRLCWRSARLTQVFTVRAPSSQHRPCALVLRVALWLILLGGSSACAAIRPYERETLARPDMQFEGNPAAAQALAHSTETREGASGGFGGGGGGCGCN